LKVPRSNLHHFNCVLILPDSFNKTQIRSLIEMVFGMGFKAILMHQESVLACYALSLSTACVVDIGATKTTVCCIEDGIMLPRSVIRKDFGGNDQTELMMRLLRSELALHYFPKVRETPELTLANPYHIRIVEALKHRLATFQMSLSASAKATHPLVNTIVLPIKKLHPATIIGPDASQLVD
jgi:actin-related protein